MLNLLAVPSNFIKFPMLLLLGAAIFWRSQPKGIPGEPPPFCQIV